MSDLRIVKQPNDLWAVWSTKAGAFRQYNCRASDLHTLTDVYQWGFTHDEIEEVTTVVLMGGNPYPQDEPQTSYSRHPRTHIFDECVSWLGWPDYERLSLDEIHKIQRDFTEKCSRPFSNEELDAQLANHLINQGKADHDR